MASSSSSSASQPSKYDVFLNFRGEDTRRGFTSHLYAALRQKALQTFFDDDDLKRGEEIAQSLPRAIQDSTVAILIFSKDYASSRWCLDELAEIMECQRSRGQIVIPVFYEVDPSHLRKQSNDVAAAFVKHEQNPINAQKSPRWKDALTKAANLSGFHSKEFRNDDLLINKIVEDILQKLNQSMPCDDFEHLVGMASRIKEIKEVFTINPSETRVLGIWGMGGVGKTTTAEVIYKMMSHQFQGGCILYDVRQKTEASGTNKLQEELIFKVLGEKDSRNYRFNASLDLFLKRRLGRMKLLIVLDDVNNPQQIESLIGDPYWFGSESMILITSRDKQVFEGMADFIYEVKLLNDVEALQLFKKSAFKQSYPEDDYASLSKSIVKYAQGNPLALKVLGSALNGKNKEEWESALTQLSKVQNKDIQQVLQISYNGLTRVEKDVFLDIACFFKHAERIYVNEDILKKVYKSSGFNIDITLSVLVDKCLVTSKYQLSMHDLLQEMGKEIVRQEAKYSYQRSRLWDPQDIYEVFAGNKEAEAVETITLDLSKITKTNLNPQVFRKMPNLRFLNFYGESNLRLSKGLDYLPNTLQYLSWDKYPLESLPPNSLVVLQLPNSNIKQLWNRVKEDSLLSQVKYEIFNIFRRLTSLHLVGNKSITHLPKGRRGILEALEILDLRGCSNLNTFPDISSNIKKLYLSESAIKQVPSSSVELLSRLEYLEMRDCKELESLPNGRSGFLKALEVLDLSGCSILNTFPEISSNIKKLYLNKTAIKQVPSSSVELLSKLEYLAMRKCRDLESLPSNFFSKLTSLVEVDLYRCSCFEALPEILEPMDSLKSLFINETAVEKWPSSMSNLKGLEVLWMNNYLFAFDRKDSNNCFSRLSLSIEGMSMLQNLIFSNCNVRESPQDLSFLSSVEYLYLRENNFERIPAIMKQLSRLKVLNIVECKGLLSLPELPSNVSILFAQGCGSLKQIWTLAQLSLYSQPLYNFNLWNCLSLDEDECQAVVNAMLRNYTRNQIHKSLMKGRKILKMDGTYEDKVKERLLQRSIVFCAYATTAVGDERELNSRKLR